MTGFLYGVLSSLFLAVSSAVVNQMDQAVPHLQVSESDGPGGAPPPGE